MKAGKPYTLYLAEQALDILTTFRTCFPSSSFVHPSRYDSAEPISQATLNRTIPAAVKRINKDRTLNQDPFCRFPYTICAKRSSHGSTTPLFQRP
jgi:hypothetical protein